MKKVKYIRKKDVLKKDEKNGVLTRILDSGIGKVVLIGVSILMVLSVYRSFKQMGQKISLLKQAEQEVSELRLENLELSLKIEEASSIDNLEKEARDRLNYGQEDEIVFVIDDDLIDIGKQRVQAILYPEESVVEQDVLEEWIDFLIEGY